MQRKTKLKKIIISTVAVVLVFAIGGGCWFYFGHRNTDPVNVYPFMNIGMTEYWGDSKESYGSVTTDNIQTVYLSNTQTVTEVLVQPGDSVKKGDVLMSFDTTLSDLALERKRLEVEKLKLQLEYAQERLWEISNMVPMVIPTPDPSPSEPSEPDLGVQLQIPYQVTGSGDFDGSTQETPVICWLNSATDIDDALFSALHAKAQELQTINQAQKPAAPPADDPTEPPTEASLSTDPSQSTTIPTAPTQSTEPSTDPAQPTDPPTVPTTPPAPVAVNSYYVIFKVTEGNMSLGQTLTWQGLYISHDFGRYTFRFFDASGITDPTLADPSDPVDEPEIDISSGYTAAQIAEMRSEQEKTIKDLEFNIKMTEADYKIMQTEMSDGKVISQIDGVVVSLLSEEDAKATGQPFLKVSGGGGFYIEGTVGEFDKASLQVGQKVTVNDWNTGMVHTGTIASIGDYPANESGYWSGNPNVTYYPFTVFVDGSADLMEGSYCSIQYAAGQVSQNGIYLENPFLRAEGGKYYVYVQGEDGLLEKRYVTTGKALWGSYTEILSGLSETDLIAFPYGKNVAEGAKTAEGDLSDLYNY